MMLSFCQKGEQAGKKGMRVLFCWAPVSKLESCSQGRWDRRHGPLCGAALASSRMPASAPVRALREELMGMGAGGQCHRGEKAVM